MTIWTLVLTFALVGGLLTFITSKFFPQKNTLLAFLQNFTGVWFIFSGAVKAVDPIGTAMKMEQYFGRFASDLSGGMFNWLVGIFPFMSNHAIVFSITMVMLEIMVGFMLILGSRNKLTSWLFLLIMVFFTVLTGYTYLTGYFDAGHFGAFKESNMKVTDCGCFGDFLKLHPKTSFIKDLFLMIPALYFIFRYRSFTPIFTRKIRAVLLGVIGAGALFFCFRNTYSNEPYIDFRPFRVGVNIREQKAAEEKAAEEQKILFYNLKNQQTGETTRISYEDYVNKKGYTKFPSEIWKSESEEKTELAVAHSKISDFSIMDKQDQNMTDSLLNDKGYTLIAVSAKIKANESKVTVIVPDSTFKYDTIRPAGKDPVIIKTLTKTGKREDVKKAFGFDPEQRKLFEKTINPIMEAAEKSGFKLMGLVAYDDPKKIEDFRFDTQSAYPFFTTDDLVIKTMMRSNPGLILMHDGKILGKWHINQLPTIKELKSLK
jgi:uncharacterized membrane protein YphA (DoxX/SURF4 family)